MFSSKTTILYLISTLVLLVIAIWYAKDLTAIEKWRVKNKVQANDYSGLQAYVHCVDRYNENQSKYVKFQVERWNCGS